MWGVLPMVARMVWAFMGVLLLMDWRGRQVDRRSDEPAAGRSAVR
jgi:hypothetical protein